MRPFKGQEGGIKQSAACGGPIRTVKLASWSEQVWVASGDVSRRFVVV